MRPATAALITALILGGGHATAASIDHSSLLSEYRISAWSGGDGITLGTIRSMVEDDGYVWLASDAGLVRFDGFRFSATDLVGGSVSLPVAATHAVYKARDGSLWVGYVNGLGVYRIARGEVRDVYLKGQTAGSVWAITEDHTGSVWIGDDEGVYRSHDHAWGRVALPFPDREHRVFDIHEDRAGTIWIAGGSGLYERMSDGTFRRYPGIDGITHSIAEDADGALWVTDEQGGFRRVGSDRNRLFEAKGMSVLRDHEGSLWIGSIGQGLWRVRRPGSRGPDVDRVTAESGLISDELSAFVDDADGNIWAGANVGLHLLTRRRVLALTDIGVVSSVTVAPDGKGWAATATGLVALEGVTSGSPGKHRVVSNVSVRTLHTTANGIVWIATSSGLHRLINDHLVALSNGAPPLPNITSIASDRFDTLWVCDEQQGLVHVTSTGSTAVPAAAFDGRRPTLAHVDGDNRVWVALDSGRIALLDRGQVRTFGSREGTLQSAVNAIAHDHAGNVWFGGNEGLTVFRSGSFRTITTAQGLPRSPVASVLADDAGDLWLGLRGVGYIRITHDELERAINDSSYQLESRHVYNAADGTAGIPDFGSVNGPDGSLWFVGSRGLTVLDPRVLRSVQQTQPPVPRIEGIMTGEGRFYGGDGVALQPRTNRIRVDYGTRNPSRVEGVRFRYRLDGFDNEWIDAGGRRQAYYTNLPPGSYRFRLQAAEGAGTWPAAVAAWSFVIQPVFYQTQWFYSVCALALLCAGVGVWRLRTRQLQKELAAIYGERIRLSREIHDTLLQSLVGITLQLDAASHDVPDRQSRVRAALVAMRKQIEDYIVEARRSIWDLRSPTLDRQDFVSAMRVAGERLTSGKVAFAVSVTGHPRRCPPKVETQALRIGQEAIINAVRHAEAQRVHLEIGFGDRYLRLRVSDDGRGFNFDEVLSSSLREHYGLVSMKERAADAGGRFTVESSPGQGARIVAEFPLDPAA